MAYPAILRNTVSVGAVYAADYGPRAYGSGRIVASHTGPDVITPYTQRLHESVNPACRTDLFAPGDRLNPTHNFRVKGVTEVWHHGQQ